MTLPVMGLGLSSNLSARARPHPYRLLDADPELFDYVEYSAPLDLDEARREASLFEEMWSRRGETPVLFHPVHLNLFGPRLESPEALARLAEHARAVGSPWVGNDVAWWHVEGRAFPGYLYAAPPLAAASLPQAALHALHVQAALDRPLLLENPAVIACRGPMHMLDFMAELHAKTGLGLLLDIGHLFAHQLSRGLAADAGLDGFPFEAVVEVHVAGGLVLPGGFYADHHPAPLRDEVLALLHQVVPRCANLKALTYEGDGHPEALAAATLRALRAIAPDPAPAPAPAPAAGDHERAPPPRQAPPAALEDPYDLVFRNTSDAPDEVAERRLRAAILAERIDRALPLSRALVDDLSEFARSDELAAVFRPRGRSLDDAFATWARRRALERGDEAAAAALAFETWALSLARAPSRPARRAPRPGAMTPSAAVRAGTFPADLSEALHAHASLARTPFAEGALRETLAQAILRAPKRPWTVVLRARGEKVEVTPVPAPIALVLEAAQRGFTPEEAAAIEGWSPEALEDALALGLVAPIRPPPFPR